MQAYPLAETARRARDLTEADRRALVEDLRRSLQGDPSTGSGQAVRGDRYNRLLYATDASPLAFAPRRAGVIEIGAGEGGARAQPGLILAELNRQAARHGLQYAIDPSTANRATIGAGVGNNSCGAPSRVYGKTLDQVLSLDAI